MKRLILRGASLLVVVSCITILYAPEQIFKENLNKNHVSNLPATRGAVIEALFILQNRRININDLKNDIILALEKAELTINELFNQKSQIAEYTPDRNSYYYEIYKSNIIKGLYNDYLKEINNFEQEIIKIIEHINQQSAISADYLEKAVKKGNLIKDILDNRASLINISFKISKQERIFEHQKNIIGNREKKLDLLKEKLNVKNGNENNLSTQISFLEKLIKKLKKELNARQKSISSKKQVLSKIKNDLTHFEDEFYKIENFNQSENFPKNWFLIRLARLQNCNKKEACLAGRAQGACPATNFVDLV